MTMTDSGPNSARRRLTNAMHAMHCDQQIIVNDRLAHELSEAWDVYDASLTASLRAELADLRYGSAHEAEEADRLRGERDRAADFRADIDAGADIADWLHAENIALRARLVQTEATLTDFANPDHWVQNDDGEWVWYGTYPPFERPALDLLGSLGSSSPEAPPVAAGEG